MYTAQMISTTPFSLKAASKEQLPGSWGMVCRMYIEGQGRGWGVSDCLGLALRSTTGHLFSISSSNTIHPSKHRMKLRIHVWVCKIVAYSLWLCSWVLWKLILDMRFAHFWITVLVEFTNGIHKLSRSFM